MAPKRLPDGRIPVLLSAHADDLVAADARAIADYLDRHPGVTVADVAGQLRKTRRVRRHRAVLRAGDRRELVDGLRALSVGREHPLVARSALAAAPRQAFVFPGQGRHWPGMGAAAYQTFAGYRAAVDGCAEALEAAGAGSALRYLTSADDSQACSEIEVQAAQFVHAVGLTELWHGCGVLPDLTIGQSLGEVAAAYVAGSITLPDAVAVVAARARVVGLLSGRYAMATLGVDAGAAEALIAATDGWAELAVVYSGSSVAVSGDRDAVAALVDAARAGGRFAREITAGFPGHTSLLEKLRDEFLALLPAAEFADTPVQFIGGASGDVVTPGVPFDDYWYANLRNTVRLDRAFSSAIRCGARSFIEVSPHPALLVSIGQVLEELQAEDAAVLVGSARRDEPPADALSANIATAAVADPGHPWGDYLGTDSVVLQGFPNAPMRAIPLWAHPEPLPPLPGAGPTLSVTVERWEPVPRALPYAGPPVRVAVVDLGRAGALGGALRAAIGVHPSAELGAPGESDVVVAVPPALDVRDAGRAADAVTGLIGAGLLRYAGALGPRCRAVRLVTVGAERVGDQARLPSALQAALAAMHRSVGHEHPERAFTQLDLPSLEPTPAAAAVVVEALLSGRADAALRDVADGHALFERTFRDVAALPAPLDSSALEDVVITGGSGTVGTHYARYLAARGARRIVLLSRRPADPDSLRGLTGRYGTRVVAAACDITDAAELSRVAAQYGAGGASLIVHAAGAAAFGATAAVSAADAADTFAAKVKGLEQLAELWPLRADARMLLCSSVSGLWGGRGHAAYSAANRLLDALAAQIRSEGRHCVAVRWGLWQGQASPARSIADAAGVADVERSGLRPMEPGEAIEASLREWGEDPLVFAADPGRLRIFLDGNRSEPLAERRTPELPVSIVDAVRRELADVLGTARPGEIDLTESLFDLGIDSLMALDLRKRLQRTTGRTVTLATLMGEITGDQLVDQLEGATERSSIEGGYGA
ncbi:mycobactin polyketide synthase MbtD [Mycobacterium sp. 050134]|uniref:mycobactin polyketide synthase MbtD n=1 Tax=Mycobacterium sp. 050134 TaxID=3096111 RepID=UPI003FA5A680